MLFYKNVFLIEDDADDQLLFIEAIEEIESSVTCAIANDGIEAFEKLETFLQLPDIIFLDINMPRMNGIEFLARLKNQQQFSAIPVVVFTTSCRDNEVYELGAEACIIKPSSFSLLRTEIKNVLTKNFQRKEVNSK